MSGRLVILPKKSYCPWNPKNVARIERDEAQHQALLVQKEETRLHAAAEQRMTMLHQRKRERQQELSHAPSPEEHFNLFDAEERREKHQKEQGEPWYHSKPGTSLYLNDNATPVPDLGTHCHPPSPVQNKYGTIPNSRESWKIRDRQRKLALDPMASYTDQHTESDDYFSCNRQSNEGPQQQLGESTGAMASYSIASATTRKSSLTSSVSENDGKKRSRREHKCSKRKHKRNSQDRRSDSEKHHRAEKSHRKRQRC